MSDLDLANNNIKPVTKTFIADLLQWGYPHDKAEGLVLLDGGRTIGVSNDDDFGVTDDGHAHLIQKILPATGLPDHNELWLFHLNKNVKSFHSGNDRGENGNDAKIGKLGTVKPGSE